MTTWGPTESDDDLTEEAVADLVTSPTGDELVWGEADDDGGDARAVDGEGVAPAEAPGAEDDADVASSDEMEVAAADEVDAAGAHDAAGRDDTADTADTGDTAVAGHPDGFEMAPEPRAVTAPAPPATDPDLPTMADLDALSAELDAVDATLVALDARSPSGDLDEVDVADAGPEVGGDRAAQREPAG